MKYYRVEVSLEGYVVQVRKWHIWRTLLEYNDRSDALMHLSSLNEGNLRISEKQVNKMNAWFDKLEKRIAKWRG